jgi:molybdenum cofactor cytidylyltransferase
MMKEGHGVAFNGKPTSSRASAVIAAARPLERADAVTDIDRDHKKILPAMIKAGQVTFIESVIAYLQWAGVAPIVVITGFEHATLERHLARMGVVSMRNEAWAETTVYDDICQGLAYIDRTCKACDRVVVTTPLVPMLNRETLASVLHAEADLALPVYNGEDGLPLAVRREMIPAILAREGASVADLIEAVPGTVERLATDEPGVLPSVGDVEDFGVGLDESDSHLPLRARLKLSLARDFIFFGPGPATLLRLIDETGSVRMACLQMKLSYSKGWQILNLLEEQLGAPVLIRRPGGQEGGSSTLTPLGHDLLARYEQLLVESQKSVNALYDAIFDGFRMDT